MLVSRVFRNMWLKPEKWRMRIWVFRRQNVHMMVRWMWSVLEEKKKRSVSTVAQMVGHNCSYLRWSFLHWPISFLFETLSNRRSLVCIFNYQLMCKWKRSVLSSHIQCVADVVRYRRFECFRNLECRKEEDFVSYDRCIDVASVNCEGWPENWQYSGIYEGSWYGAHV